MFIDANQIGSVANGKEEIFDVAPGRHTVFVGTRKVGGMQSEALELELTPNGLVELECAISPQYFQSARNALAKVLVTGIVLVPLYQWSVHSKGTTAYTALSVLSFLCSVIGTAILTITAISASRLLSKPGGICYLKEAGAKLVRPMMNH